MNSPSKVFPTGSFRVHIDEQQYRNLIGLSDAPALHLEISRGCNIHCAMCTFHDDLKKVAWTSLDDVKTLVKGMDYFGVVHLGDGSEPLLNPYFNEIAAHFRSQGLKVSAQTNAKLIRDKRAAEKLVKSGLNQLSISLEGVTDSTVTRIREGVTFTAILKAIDLVNNAKKKFNSKTPHLMANAVAMRSNLVELPSLAEFLLDKGFIRFRIGFLELRKAHSDLVNELLVYEQVRARQTISEIKSLVARSPRSMYLDVGLFSEGAERERRSDCTIYRDRIYVRYDGEVFACYGKRRIGNIYVDGIDACISSAEYQKYVEEVTRPNNPICEACTFCRVMSLNNVTDHFGRAALNHYSSAVVEGSIAWAEKGGKIEDYWAEYYARSDDALMIK